MAKAIMRGKQAVLTYITTEITTDQTDKTTATKHTHEVSAKSTCKFGAHDKRLACLGPRITPEKVRNDRGKICRKQFSLGGGCLWARAKWSCSLHENVMKMIPMERSRRAEKVSAGITLFGVTGKKIPTYKAEGLVYKRTPTNRSLVV